MYITQILPKLIQMSPKRSWGPFIALWNPSWRTFHQRRVEFMTKAWREFMENTTLSQPESWNANMIWSLRCMPNVDHDMVNLMIEHDVCLDFYLLRPQISSEYEIFSGYLLHNVSTRDYDLREKIAEQVCHNQGTMLTESFVASRYHSSVSEFLLN